MTSETGRQMEVTCPDCEHTLRLGLRELVDRPGRRCPSCAAPLAGEGLQREMEKIRRFLDDLSAQGR